ncbi:NAD-dependent epimerase/dehydratase family protein [Methylibium sp.]|uniref:NAD-dependent epimerase/dehydratase family protein n=1 Tax=Methylibium sp. TaxID=2067992 RepID=UPI003D146055
MRVFITGAAGYIGGTVATALLAAGYQVSGLVRTEEKANALRERGVTPITGSLDDAELLTASAQAADLVVNAASADHAASVVTLVTALERSGKTLIHTSGSSIVADHADGEFGQSGGYTEDDFFEPVPYRRARVDLNRYVRQAAIDKGVRTIVICPGMIYGTGRGLNPHSDQLPKLMALSQQVGAAVYFGKGLNRYSNVHVDDLADLYLLANVRAPGGAIYFAENGHNSFKEIAELISAALGLKGTVGLDVEDVLKQYGEAGRLGVASNSLISASNARRMGWVPSRPSLVDYFRSLR